MPNLGLNFFPFSFLHGAIGDSIATEIKIRISYEKTVREVKIYIPFNILST